MPSPTFDTAAASPEPSKGTCPMEAAKCTRTAPQFRADHVGSFLRPQVFARRA